MSNFGDQARLPTDRPPDRSAVDAFPKTKTILWDKTAIGKATYLHLCYFRKSRICIPEKVLKLVQHQCEIYGQKDHTLIGTLIVEDDGEAVQFQVDRLDTRPIMSADVSSNLAPGDLLIPLEVTNNTAGKRKGSVDDFVTALKRLQDRCCSKSSIDLSSFVLLRGWVSFYSNAHSSVAHMDFDMVTMGTVFKATPIANVPIVLTALSKNLAGPMSLSHTQGTPKSGRFTIYIVWWTMHIQDIERDMQPAWCFTISQVKDNAVYTRGTSEFNVLSPMGLGNTRKGIPSKCLHEHLSSGDLITKYLTMDHTRKLLLVLESDPKAGTLPIVGIWVSGVEFIQHSFVWAACLRYIHNTHLQDRVCAPPDEFLLVLYSPLHSRPEFYQCSTTTGESKLMYELFCGHEVCNHTKSLSSQSDDFTEVELSSERNGDEKALFDAALAKHSTHVFDGHSEKRWSDDINPRSIPTPHTEMLPVIKPMVPDVSILWTDSPNNSALPPPSSMTPVASSQSPFITSINNVPPGHLMSYPQPYNAQQILPTCQTQAQPRPSVLSNRAQCSNPQFSSTSGLRNAVHIPQPHIPPPQQRHPIFQNSSSSSFVPNDSVNSYSTAHIPYNVNRNTLNSHNDVKNTTPMFHTQNQAVSLAPSSNPYCSRNNQYSLQDNHSAPNPVYTPPSSYFNGNNPHPHMVLSTRGHNTYLTSQNTTVTSSQGHGPNQPFSASPQAPVASGFSIPNSAPHLSVKSHSRPVDEEASHRVQTAPFYNSLNSNENNNNNASHPLSRNHFVSVNTLNTVIEETSSNSSSSSTTTCGGCKCQSEKNVSVLNTNGIPRQYESDACVTGNDHNVTDNTTKSSDDDSGLSVTPERPNSSPPPPPPPQPSALESSVVGGNSTLSQDKYASAFGETMNNVNWNHVPPEIKCLLIQQNEQLQLLQQQIQMLMLNQSSQLQKSSSAAGIEMGTSSHLPIPSQSTSSSSNSRESCSIAVNTSFTGDNRHHLTEVGSQLLDCSQAKVHASESSLESECLQRKDEVSHNSIPVQSTYYSNALDDTNTSSLSTRVSSSDKLFSPRAQNDFDRVVVEGDSSVSFEHSKDPRNSLNAAGVSEMDLNRSQVDPSYPNDSDFYNCQDESYSTVAEEATDPRQFYDQIMSNINMFLTNGDDNSVELTEKDEQLSVQDNTTKFSESANSSLFPHINYMSMLLGGSSDTGQSMEINAMAMKYLKDDQLTQMAMMLKQNGGSEEHSTNKLLQRMINSGGGNSRNNDKKSSLDVSHLGMSPNNLTMGTRNYLEKHGLLGQDSQCFNDYSVLDHTFKLKTDFSVAMTDRDADKSSGNIRSLSTSPIKNYIPSPLLEPKNDPVDDARHNLNHKRNNYPKDMGASPVLLPAKHYNMRHSPAQRVTSKSPKGGCDSFDDDDNADNENILDIAKLKQLPKLL